MLLLVISTTVDDEMMMLIHNNNGDWLVYDSYLRWLANGLHERASETKSKSLSQPDSKIQE
jgi:hypothetical protein